MVELEKAFPEIYNFEISNTYLPFELSYALSKDSYFCRFYLSVCGDRVLFALMYDETVESTRHRGSLRKGFR